MKLTPALHFHFSEPYDNDGTVYHSDLPCSRPPLAIQRPNQHAAISVWYCAHESVCTIIAASPNPTVRVVQIRCGEFSERRLRDGLMASLAVQCTRTISCGVEITSAVENGGVPKSLTAPPPVSASAADKWTPLPIMGDRTSACSTLHHKVRIGNLVYPIPARNREFECHLETW